jgi:putative hemolysin
LEPLKIDVEKVFSDKNPGLARLIPGFVFRWLKRIIHQEEINNGLRIGMGKKDIEFAEFSMDYLQAKVSSVGLERIPASGGVIIAANHPLGGLDGIALVKEVGRVRSDVRFVVNDILTRLPNFENVFVGVNKHGANARASLEAIDKAYSGGFAVLVFPAGLCSRKQDDGSIKDLVWQKSFLTRAIKNQLPLVPTFVEGKNSSWFYNLSRWRKKLGIKANIEMLYLPDEMFRQRGQMIRIHFGRPIPPEVWDKSRKPEEWAALLRDFIYFLPEKPDLTFEDYLKNLRS